MKKYDFKTLFKHLCSLKGVKGYEVAEKVGITKSTYYRQLPNKNKRLKTVVSLFGGLGLNFEIQTHEFNYDFTEDTIAEFYNCLYHHYGLKPRAICERVGLSPSAIDQQRKNNSMKLETLQKVLGLFNDKIIVVVENQKYLLNESN